MLKAETFIVGGFLLFCISALIYQILIAPRNRIKQLRKNLNLNGFVSKSLSPQLKTERVSIFSNNQTVSSDPSQKFTEYYGFLKTRHTYTRSNSVSISESFMSPSGFWCCSGLLIEKRKSTSRVGYLFRGENRSYFKKPCGLSAIFPINSQGLKYFSPADMNC